jgi:hypothetical protein
MVALSLLALAVSSDPPQQQQQQQHYHQQQHPQQQYREPTATVREGWPVEPREEAHAAWLANIVSNYILLSTCGPPTHMYPCRF